MESAEDRIRRLRSNAFEDDEKAAEAEQAAADAMGVSVEEYRRGQEVGVWRRGPEVRRPPFNARLLGPTSGPKMHAPLLKERRVGDQAVRQGFKNDT